MKAAAAQMSGSREQIRTSGIYLVTDTAACGPRGVVDTVRAAVAGGVKTIQVREKNASAADFHALVLAVAEAAANRALVLVDDRVDIYLAARAARAAVHGVHVGQNDLPVELVRTLVGQDAVVGLTANKPDHLDFLAALPPGTVDYLGTGVIRPTGTKPDHPAPLGISGFADFAARTQLPVVAIGGICREDVGALRAAGAAGAAVVSAICGAANPQTAATDLVRAWQE